MQFVTCTICSSDQNVRECGRCHAAAYCSKECQKEDWHLHKLLCKCFSEFLQTKPIVPKESSINKYVLGILYPVKENMPTLYWVPVETIWDKDELEHSFLLYKPESIFGEWPSTHIVQVNPRTSHLLRSTLVVHFRDAFLRDGSVSNEALAITVKGHASHDWRGPILVTRITDCELDGPFRDIDLQDFRHVTDFFVSSGGHSSYGLAPKQVQPLSKTDANTRPSKSTTSVPTSTKSNQQVFNEKKMHTGRSAEGFLTKGVEKLTIGPTDTAKMKIEGVQIKATDKPGDDGSSYTAVAIHPNHEIFWALNSRVSQSEIAMRIGLPLLILHYPVTANSSSTANVPATWLHINTDEKSNEFGWAPKQWRIFDVGTILVVREDKVRLTPKQMEIICNFCQHRMGPLFEHSIGAWDLDLEEPKSREYVLEAMTPEKFEQFFIGYRTAKGWSSSCNEYDCRNPYTGLEL